MSAISSGRPNFERSSQYSPEKLYDISVIETKDGVYRVSLRFGGKMEGNYLYYFRNKVSGKMYVGESRRLGSRVSVHLSTANKFGQPSTKKTSQKLYAHLKAHPEHFDFGMLKLGDDESPRKKEVDAIAHYASQNRRLYNRNRGGGGPRGGVEKPKMGDPKENSIVQNLKDQFDMMVD